MPASFSLFPPTLQSGPEPAAARPEAQQPPAAELSEEEREAAAKKEAAAAEKAKGNEAYRAKRFDEALAHYDAAIALFDGDISFATNKCGGGLPCFFDGGEGAGGDTHCACCYLTTTRACRLTVGRPPPQPPPPP